MQVTSYGRTVFKSPSGHSADLHERTNLTGTSTHPVNIHRHATRTQRHVNTMPMVSR